MRTRTILKIRTANFSFYCRSTQIYILFYTISRFTNEFTQFLHRFSSFYIKSHTMGKRTTRNCRCCSQGRKEGRSGGGVFILLVHKIHFCLLLLKRSLFPIFPLLVITHCSPFCSSTTKDIITTTTTTFNITY